MIATTIATGNKEHFYLNRTARMLFQQHDPEFLRLSADMQESQKKAEEQSKILNSHIASGEGILPAQLHGMKLLHEVLHYVLSKTAARRNPALLADVRRTFEESLPERDTARYLNRFLESFPTAGIFSGTEKTDVFLQEKANREEVLEESLLVWLNNQNPALDRLSAYISDKKLREENLAHLGTLVSVRKP